MDRGGEKLLGIILDEDLSFSNHIDKLCSKLAKRIGLLKKLRYYLPLDERIAFYNATIKSAMMFGSCVWSNTTKDNLDQITKLQKRAARVILDASTRDRSIPLFSKLGWIPFSKEVEIRKAMICHKRFYGNCPSYIIDILPTNASRHNRNTRYQDLTICLPKTKRQNDGGRSFAATASRFWNSLPLTMRKLSSATLFKKKLYDKANSDMLIE
ncbi:uncharacterized protein LOC124437938 [Xenia sp. Carnegie-2017]|uniref:uncharacterized protein LOC124437938 n=1 Tax=Xenia sp. Carnegie-2017 TaxID=2897299 RepID=UPI001F0438D9|nr:uncharacterized protein LOC124437938 [Xenia sp. Carnegie-2017]